MEKYITRSGVEASPVVGAFGDLLTLGLTEVGSQVRVLPLGVGTAGRPEVDQRAGLLVATWLCRAYAPAWLRLAGLVKEAHALAVGGEITSWGDLPLAALEAAREAADAAYEAAWEEADARDAMDEAYEAHDVAQDAIVATGGWAARQAVRVRDAPGIDRFAAMEAAVDLDLGSYHAALDSAIAAAIRTGGGYEAARSALGPTVRELQGGAVRLYGQMVGLYR